MHKIQQKKIAKPSRTIMSVLGLSPGSFSSIDTSSPPPNLFCCLPNAKKRPKCEVACCHTARTPLHPRFSDFLPTEAVSQYQKLVPKNGKRRLVSSVKLLACSGWPFEALLALREQETKPSDGEIQHDEKMSQTLPRNAILCC